MILIALSVLILLAVAVLNAPLMPDDYGDLTVGPKPVSNRRPYLGQRTPIVRLTHLGRVMQARQAVRGDDGYCRRT